MSPRGLETQARANIPRGMDRRTQLQQKADEWIERNPEGYRLLVHRSLARAQKGERFSIRQLCESLRWEKQNGILSGVDEFAIPNAITRYIGLRIMEQHPATEEHMTTRKPEPATDVYPQGNAQGVDNQRGVSGAIAAWVKEVLSCQEQVLVWRLDLESTFGSSPDPMYPDLYPDGRVTRLIDRLKSRLKISKGTTTLTMMVRCREGWPEREYVRVEYGGNTQVNLSQWIQHQPPAGCWAIMSRQDARIDDNIGIPVTYFRDGIPF